MNAITPENAVAVEHALERLCLASLRPGQYAQPERCRHLSHSGRHLIDVGTGSGKNPDQLDAMARPGEPTGDIVANVGSRCARRHPPGAGGNDPDDRERTAAGGRRDVQSIAEAGTECTGERFVEDDVHGRARRVAGGERQPAERGAAPSVALALLDIAAVRPAPRGHDLQGKRAVGDRLCHAHEGAQPVGETIVQPGALRQRLVDLSGIRSERLTTIDDDGCLCESLDRDLGAERRLEDDARGDDEGDRDDDADEGAEDATSSGAAGSARSAGGR